MKTPLSPGRRRLLQAGAAAAALGSGAVRAQNRPLGRVVVVGAGFGGATAAKYIRIWEPRIEVTLVEREAQFVSCPVSNLVLAGIRQMADITRPYGGLAARGIRVVRGEATAVDPARREVRLGDGSRLPFDRAVIAPGIDFLSDRIPGLVAAEREGRVLHAWKAGPQTVSLRARLESMRDGGVFAICVPKMPYRCPPGPYERACLVAHYFRQHKPKSKVVILDANADLVSKKALFVKAWADLYPGTIEYVPNAELVQIDAARGRARLAGGSFDADLFNVVPPQRAGRLAQPFAGAADNPWVAVDFRTFEAKKGRGIHVVGDAIATAPGMPKSALMANNHGKVAADAIVASLAGLPPNEEPIIANTCYSYVSPTLAVHVASVHAWSAEHRTLLPVQGAGGLSTAPNELEGVYANWWAQNIWADTLG